MWKVAVFSCFFVAVLVPGAPVLADDAELARKGKRQFVHCVGCHTLDADARPRLGPHLEGIVGREVASVADFDYSDQLRGQSFTWTEEKLDQWLASPQEDVHDMCMPFMGIAKPEARRALIAYLKDPTRR